MEEKLLPDGQEYAAKCRRFAIISNCYNPVIGIIESYYIPDFNFISQIKYIYLNAVSGVMHDLAKWIESDPVFHTLGTLIIGTGILVLAGLILYTCGFLI